MKVLAACEESQEVCKAFRALGHEAYSCDILECSGGHPEWHIQADILPLLNGNCTFTTMDGVKHRIDGKWDYEPNNVVSCCKICNYAKSNLTKDDFINWAIRVAEHSKAMAEQWGDQKKLGDKP